MKKIFLGSTFTDLVDYRASVIHAIDRLRLQGFDVNWIGMEAFSASNHTPLEECLRYVNESDIYLGFFGVRYGSKIPGSDESFTEAEFRRAVECKIPLLLFLIDENEASVKPKDFERDPKSLERLTALKKEIGAIRNVKFFKSPEDLASQVLTALPLYLQRESPTPGSVRPDLASAREQYAAHLVDAMDKIDATRIAAALDRTLERIALTQVYVELKASASIPERDVRELGTTVAGRKVGENIPGSIANDPVIRAAVNQLGAQLVSATFALHDALAKFPGLVILGDPGSGKSTFLKYAAVAFAQNDQTKRLGIVEQRLPIFLTIAAYAECLREDKHQTPLADYFAKYYRDMHGLDSDLAELFDSALKQGRTIVLLDGLDEVKDVAERARVADQVEKFWCAHRKAGNRLVITSRIIGYEKLHAEGLTHLTLHDFDDDAIQLFLKQWCPVIERAAESDPTTAARNAAREQRELTEAIFHGTTGVRELAANPLLLTLLALIKRKGVRLPEQRVELYEEYIKALIENWALHRNPDRIITHTPKYAEVERVVAALALWMRETNPEAGTVDQPAVEEWLTRRHGSAMVSPDEARRAAQKFVADLRHDSGLIVERGHRIYGFIHQTLEEYLAAKGLCYLSGTDLDPLMAEMRAHKMLERDIWRETTLLAVGHLSVIQHTPDRAAQLVENILCEELRGNARGMNVVRAGEALRDIGRAGVTDAVWNTTLDTLKTTMQSITHPIKTRATAGETLDALGWLPDDLDAFVPITERGKILFYIAKYPVTCSQYQKFIDAGGYENEKYWRDQRGVVEKGKEKKLGDEAYKWLQESGGAERRPYAWDNPHFHRAGYPVVGVTWYEATAYCKWLTDVILSEANAERLPVHSEVLRFAQNDKTQARLPTEAEWVRAAGGEANDRYAWDEPGKSTGQSPDNKRKEIVLARANVKESGINGTTPVAMYPDGKRVTENGEEIWDLAGNVWEWTNILHKEYTAAYLRSSSWYSESKRAIVSARDVSARGDLSVSLGVRVVVASSSFPRS
ncbi:MAG: SUMF1/EgtB/PvdO family nonheme iron enzyme [Chloroflexi bacterium]|nr:SUMF1/EgtB/PvdO family nonheme iron enzyme [Chloroflexota bacterium]